MITRWLLSMNQRFDPASQVVKDLDADVGLRGQSIADDPVGIERIGCSTSDKSGQMGVLSQETVLTLNFSGTKIWVG